MNQYEDGYKMEEMFDTWETDCSDPEPPKIVCTDEEWYKFCEENDLKAVPTKQKWTDDGYSLLMW